MPRKKKKNLLEKIVEGISNLLDPLIFHSL
jgi:hypothetical protein